MARTALAVQEITRNGLPPYYSPANADGHRVANDENGRAKKTVVHVKNGGGSAITAAILTAASVDGLSIADPIVTVPAGETRIIGPFPPGTYNQPDGTVHIDLSGVTGVGLISHAPNGQEWHESWRASPSRGTERPVGKMRGPNRRSWSKFNLSLGSVDISPEPDQSTSKTQKAKIALSQLLKSRENATILLDLVDETFHQMPLFVNVLVIRAGFLPLGSRWNNHFGFGVVTDHVDELIRIIALVANQSLEMQVDHQRLRLRDVVALPSGQQQAQRIAQSIDTDVNFGADATTTRAYRVLRLAAVFFTAPAAHGWARTMVLSRIRCSISGSSAK